MKCSFLKKSVNHFEIGGFMNYRQHKKQMFHKRKKHGYWKKHKKQLRKVLAECPCRIDSSKFPNRRRVRQLYKYYDYWENSRFAIERDCIY